jgi:hypothetical protein
MFPVSLDGLCKTFNVEGKQNPYNIKYNNIKLFNNPRLFSEFAKYAIQDSIALLKALNRARSIYDIDYNVDICNSVSTSSLSLNIYRTNFQTDEIPVLDPKLDRFIRQAYHGGSTDDYKGYGKNLYHYDVNSLYPTAMCKDMPHKLI